MNLHPPGVAVPALSMAKSSVSRGDRLEGAPCGGPPVSVAAEAATPQRRSPAPSPERLQPRSGLNLGELLLVSHPRWGIDRRIWFERMAERVALLIFVAFLLLWLMQFFGLFR